MPYGSDDYEGEEGVEGSEEVFHYVGEYSEYPPELQKLGKYLDVYESKMGRFVSTELFLDIIQNNGQYELLVILEHELGLNKQRIKLINKIEDLKVLGGYPEANAIRCKGESPEALKKLIAKDYVSELRLLGDLSYCIVKKGAIEIGR